MRVFDYTPINLSRLNTNFAFIPMKYLSLLAAFTATFSLGAQTEHIPVTTSTAMIYDLSLLGKKMDLKTIGKYKNFKPADSVEYGLHNELVKNLMSDLAGSGIDMTRKYITFSDKLDTFRSQVYLFPIADAKKTVKAIDAFIKKFASTQTKPVKTSTKGTTWYDLTENQFGCAVFKNMAVLVDGPSFYYEEYGDEYRKEAAEDSVKAIIDSIRYSRPPVITTPPDEEPPADGSDVPDGAADEYYDYDSDSLMVAFRTWWESEVAKKRKAYWAGKEKLYHQYMESVWMNKDKKTGLVFSRSDFKSETASPAEILHWVDYTQDLTEMASSMARYKEYNDSTGYYDYKRATFDYLKSPFGKLFGNLHFTGRGSFETGFLNINYRMAGSDSLRTWFNKSMGTSVDQSLFQLVKVPEVSFLMAQKMDFSTVTDFTMLMYEKMYETAEWAKPQGTASTNEFMPWLLAFMQLQRNLLDANLAKNTFSGDMVAAVTGKTSMTRTFVSWEYDDEGNSKRVRKTETTEVPSAFIAMKLSNPANLDAYLSPFTKYGLLKKVRNDVFTFTGIDEFKTAIYFIRHQGNFIITNDSLYTVAEYLQRPGGLSTELMSKAAAQGSYMRTDGGAIAKLLEGMAGISPASLTQSSKLTGSIKNTETTCSNTDAFEIRTRVEFNNKTRNSLVELLELSDNMR